MTCNHWLPERLLVTKRIPKPYLKEMRKIARRNEANGIGAVKLGRIDYIVNEKPEGYKVATTWCYYPKSNVSGKLKGLGYYLEALSTKHLERNGIRRITTSMFVNESRKEQLKRAKLKPETETGVAKWLKGLGRGIRRGMLKNKVSVAKEKEVAGNKRFFASLKNHFLQKIK